MEINNELIIRIINQQIHFCTSSADNEYIDIVVDELSNIHLDYDLTLIYQNCFDSYQYIIENDIEYYILNEFKDILKFFNIDMDTFYLEDYLNFKQLDFKLITTFLGDLLIDHNLTYLLENITNDYDICYFDLIHDDVLLDYNPSTNTVNITYLLINVLNTKEFKQKDTVFETVDDMIWTAVYNTIYHYLSQRVYRKLNCIQSAEYIHQITQIDKIIC